MMTAEKSKKRMNKTALSLIIAIAAVAVLSLAVVLLNSHPEPVSDDSSYTEADYTSTLDEAGVHYAVIPSNSDGEPVHNGSGALLSYTAAEVVSVTVDNRAESELSFTLRAHAHEGEAVEYSIDGLEDFRLQTGQPDSVAHNAAMLSFISIASVGGSPADFGLDSPRLTVTVAYSDGTSAVILVGDEAPASAGTYIGFGSGEAVYLVATDAVESFFTKPTGFVSLTITSSADTVDDNTPKKITLSGSLYPETVTLEPDEDADYSYKLTSPVKAAADTYAASTVAGSIRDLYAEEVAAVNTDGSDTEAFLARYGLDEPYAEVEAEYPDTVIRMRASEPDADGAVYLASEADGYRVIYKIQLGAVSWANTSLASLTAE